MRIKRAAIIAALCLAALVAEDVVVPLAEAQAASGEIVVAQNDQRGGVFRFLTRPFRRREAAPQPAPQVAPQRQQQARPRRQQQQQEQASRPSRERQRQSAPAQPAAPVVAAVEKSANAKRILVIGDFMAGALANGLTDTYAESANVLVIDATNGSSGLVRDDYYNWPAELPAIVEAQKPDTILVLVGANDRQAIANAGNPGSDEWRAAYAARVALLADALKATGRPALWIGLAPVNSGNMSRDYSAFNGIVREQLESKGLKFIDIWDGFADAEGKFAAVGPDVTGQSVQLRTGDLGLNFTRSGQRKLAYFVEQDLNAILGGAAEPVVAVVESGPSPAQGAAAASAAGETIGEPVERAAPLPVIGPMVNIETLTLGDELSAPAADSAASATAATAILSRVAGEGTSPPADRIDNYTWPASPN